MWRIGELAILESRKYFSNLYFCAFSKQNILYLQGKFTEQDIVKNSTVPQRQEKNLSLF